VKQTGEISPPIGPPTSNRTPLTSLAVTTTATSPPRHTLFAGAWDKAVYGFALSPPSPSSTGGGGAAAAPPPLALKPLRGAHTDFVKALLALPPAARGAPPLLLSAGADGAIALWDAAAGALLQVVRGAHARAVLALALADDGGDGDGPVVVSADSTRELRAWRVDAGAGTLTEVPLVETLAPRDDGDGGVPATAPEGVEGEAYPRGPDGRSAVPPLVAHETSVLALAAAPSTGDLWTASADGTAKCLARAAAFRADAVLRHPDHVGAVAVCERAGLVLTACRDEGVRAWDAATGELVAALLRAHWEEVTSVVVAGRWAVSAGIDGTVRRWELARDALVEEMRRMESAEEAVPEARKESLLTEEEERELADLMGDDSD
jgi:WD40 repeat protein